MSMTSGVGVRLAIVKTVGRTFIDFQFLDALNGQVFRAPIPHPYAGRGGGIFVGIERDALILVTNGPGEKWYCIAVVPDHNFYFGLDGAADIRVHESPYPKLKEGEVVLKSNQGSRVDLLDNGNVRLNAGAGDSLSDFELSRVSNAMFTRVDSQYSFTNASRLISGAIKRDMMSKESAADTNTMNFLDSERYERLLQEIGRYPKNETHLRTTKMIKDTFRNPSLAEKREIIYEYANSYNVKDFESEVTNSRQIDGTSVDLQYPSGARATRRTDILNLNQQNFNHLIEKVEGTLVDIYGNVLDINRNIVNVPEVTDVEADGGDTDGLRRVYDHHRRSIKMHYEINSRKPIAATDATEADKVGDNAKNFSRWSVDVDGEGLTKINIPASSETGNIPVLSRYFTSVDDADINAIPPEERKNSDRRDVSIKQFGPDSGTKIKNDNYRPVATDDRVVTVGTAHHNLMETAELIITGGSLNGHGQLNVPSAPPLSAEVDNTIGGRGGPATGANAGGRSLNINLDGSLEMSVGADSVDQKSMLLDTQGGVISHFGRDRNGRSLVHQADGYMLIQIGSSDTPLGQGAAPGRLEIHLARGEGTPQKILIDENGITIDVQGNAAFNSTGDMALNAGGKLLMHGELIYMYGAVETEDRKITGSERLVVRSGSPVF